MREILKHIKRSEGEKEGDRVTVYIYHLDGKNEGVYPDWVDVLPPKEKDNK